MGRIVLLTSLVVFVAQAPKPLLTEEPSRELAGRYYCHGTDASGDGYGGVVQIGKQGDVYYLQCPGHAPLVLGSSTAMCLRSAISAIGRRRALPDRRFHARGALERCGNTWSTYGHEVNKRHRTLRGGELSLQNEGVAAV